MNKLYSLEKLEEIAQGDDVFIQDMITTFIDNVSEEIKNIPKLTDAGEWETIKAIAHKIAPSYAYMGAESLFALAANIEKEIRNDGDLSEITAMTHRMYADSLVLIDELKKNFDKQ